ncbi:MAG: hypothetical protein J5687_07050 [Treponema sp.]|nr:hypothetical protein [Treponema sp.]
MKKLLVSLLLMTTIFASTFAQAYDVVEAGEEIDFNHNEVYLAAGMPSFLGLFAGVFVALGEGLAKSLNQNNEEGGQTTKSNEAAFSITGGYNYYFTENFGVGAFANYEKFGSLSLIAIQAKLTAQYGWEHFKIYHAASGGIMFIPGGDKPGFVFDVTYLGLKLDFEDWNIFVDASIPTTGIVKAGASFKF